MSDRSSPVGRRGLALVAGAAAFLLVGAIVAALLLPGADGGDAAPTDGIAAGEGFACDPNEAVQMVPYLDGTALVATDRVARIGLSGSTAWNVSLATATPRHAVAGGRLLVYDEGGFGVAVFSADGLVWQATTSAPIDGATLSASGHVVVLTDVAGYKGTIGVYAPDGAWLFGWQSAETGYVLSAAVDPTGSRVDVSALYTDGAAARPVLRSFSMAGGSIAEKTLDAGSALPLLAYDEEGRTVLCGEDAAVGFRQGASAGEVAYRLDAPGIRTVIPTAKGLAWIRAGAGGAGLVAARIRGGTEGPACALPSELAAVAARGDRLAAASGRTVSIVDLATGRIALARTFDDDVLALGFSDDRRLVVVTKSSVRRIALS